MTMWLESYRPQRFADLLTSTQVIEALTHLSLQANPPHLLCLVHPDVEKQRPISLFAGKYSAPLGVQRHMFFRRGTFRRRPVPWRNSKNSFARRSRDLTIHLQDEPAWMPSITTSACLRIRHRHQQVRKPPHSLPANSRRSRESSSSRMPITSAMRANPIFAG